MAKLSWGTEGSHQPMAREKPCLSFRRQDPALNSCGPGAGRILPSHLALEDKKATKSMDR